jgi:hypothetical protein
MMLFLRGSSRLQTIEYMTEFTRPRKLSFIYRGSGILAVLREVPSDRVLHNMELNITNKDPKLDKLNNMIPCEGSK